MHRYTFLASALLASSALAAEPPAAALASSSDQPAAAADAAPAVAAAPEATALAVFPTPSPGAPPTVLLRPDDLRDFIPGDDPLHRRAASAAARKGGALGFGILAAGAAVLVVPLLLGDFMDFAVDGQGPRVPRFVVALGVSVGSGGLALGLNASANREARAVADAWNAAHPERPVDWRP